MSVILIIATEKQPRSVYRQLREQITLFFLRGGDVFSLEKLEAMARE